jgi:hypothetical protein
MTNLAYTNTRHRADWRDCYDHGSVYTERKYRKLLAKLVTDLGMKIDERINTQLYLPPKTMKEMLLRILALPYHIWLVWKLDVVNIVRVALPHISEENREYCEKWVILGAINSILSD